MRENKNNSEYEEFKKLIPYLFEEEGDFTKIVIYIIGVLELINLIILLIKR